MDNRFETERVLVAREVAHWTMAAARLYALEDFAAPNAWNSLESYLGVALRKRLRAAIERLQHKSELLRQRFNHANTESLLNRVRQQLVLFRQHYIRTETTLDFYADAINTRTNETVAGLLRACDKLAQLSMVQMLDQFGIITPPVLTYLDKGMGASILKAGLRLWDQNVESPAAAIKVVRHNLYRPTSLIHEAGHQVAHLTNWRTELAEALRQELPSASDSIGELWSSWASEIAADAFAFVHTGYAAIAGLHDVVSGGQQIVFRHIPGDPHPISYLRVLLGTTMCKQIFGNGVWDDLAMSWIKNYPIQMGPAALQPVLARSRDMLPDVAKLVLNRPMAAFHGKSLVACIDPKRVAPYRLQQLQQQAGTAFLNSTEWIESEAIRMLALFGYRLATQPEQAQQILDQQHRWMLKLGA